ncbi:MAG: exodeoxyribonuclease VII large subunit [Desulfuromonas sp.]|nr:exodeoxyribonuclease VII large subunit [Desulfuromonas sp.]
MNSATLKAPSILSISAATELIKETLEDNFAQIWLGGEISNLSTPASGHWYFTLKDSRSQLRCAMFRAHNRNVNFTPENGQQVICHGRISLYSQRGDVQFINDSMEIEGLGNLQLAFEQLKNRLNEEGLFSETHKQPLPEHPTTIGVITSATGAAIHDIMNVLTRRAAGVRIILRPVLVQGEQSATEVAAAIEEFNQHAQADVLIVGRGGGSLEDLQSFNSEVVARAIHASAIPIISAVGHETDFTIADFVADRRAPTPSAAAELVVKNRQDLEQHLDQLTLRLQRAMHHNYHYAAEQLSALSNRLRSPQQLLNIKQQRLAHNHERLLSIFARHLQQQRDRVALLSAQLNALSPLHTLERGFAAVSKRDSRHSMVSRAKQLHQHDEISLRFSDGQVRAKVEKVDLCETAQHPERKITASTP